ncbi:mitochondrial 37S ribosomal protein uS10m [Dipodascopsis tothii]|uniref:mitochondrial 37S ribosomal protein uS10m n=1 Tax=Dipodascopsis tothii TaxID=44089 RepID=UPI0034CFA2D2
MLALRACRAGRLASPAGVARAFSAAPALSKSSKDSVEPSRVLAYDPSLGPDIFSGVERTYVPSPVAPDETTGRPIPLNIALTKLAPFRVQPTHGNVVCELQFAGFAADAVEQFADFAARTAFFLDMPAKGPFTKPKRTERWTVIRSPFVHAKSKENFERITHKRGLQLLDSNTETVELFLAFLRKYSRPGVGIKAQLFATTALKDYASATPAKTDKPTGKVTGKAADKPKAQAQPTLE